MVGIPGPRHTLISKVGEAEADEAEVGEPGRLMVTGWIMSPVPASLG